MVVRNEEIIKIKLHSNYFKNQLSFTRITSLLCTENESNVLDPNLFLYKMNHRRCVEYVKKTLPLHYFYFVQNISPFLVSNIKIFI